MLVSVVMMALVSAGTSAAAIDPGAGRVHVGVTVDGALGIIPELDAYAGSAGKAPSIVMDYRDWAHHGSFPADFADLVVARGATPMLTWEPWDYSAGVDQPRYRLNTIAGGQHDAHIQRWAGQIKAWNKPIFMRFAHEMNGDWYPWSERVNGNAAGQ